MRLWDFGFRYAACGTLALGCPAGILAQGGQQTAARDAQLVGASHEQAVSPIVGASQSNRPRVASAIEETASAELPDSPGAVQSQSQSASPHQNSPFDDHFSVCRSISRRRRTIAVVRDSRGKVRR